MANAFAAYLPRFDLDIAPLYRPASSAATAETGREELPVDRVAEAEERGRMAGQAAALAEFALLRAEDAARAEQALAEARRRWAEDESERLASQFRAAIEAVEATLAAAAARVLLPFLAAEAREKAMAEFCQTVSDLFADSKDTMLTISGPEDLLAAVRERLGSYSNPIAFTPAPTAEVRATAGETIAESQLRAWVDRLAMAGR